MPKNSLGGKLALTIDYLKMSYGTIAKPTIRFKFLDSKDDETSGSLNVGGSHFFGGNAISQGGALYRCKLLPPSLIIGRVS